MEFGFDSSEVMEAEAECEMHIWTLGKKYPAGRTKKYARPEKGRHPTRLRGSLLKTDLKEEDIVERWEPTANATGAGWDDDWGDGWSVCASDTRELSVLPSSLRKLC